MTIHRFRRIHKGQRGITLPELLVVVVIIGLISGGIALLISRTISGSARDSDVMILVRQVQQAGQAVSTDVLQAAQILYLADDLSDDEFLKLEWSDGDERSYKVVYQLSDMQASLDLARLVRTESVYLDGNEDPVATNTRMIAQYIDRGPEQTSFKPSGTAFVFKVTARVGQHIETREYQVRPRVEQ